MCVRVYNVTRVGQTYYVYSDKNLWYHIFIYPFVGVSGEQCNVMLSMFVECIMQWTHFNSLLCKEFGKAGVLHFFTTILRAYTKSKPPNEVCGI